MVSRPAYLGVKHPSGDYDQIFITVRQLWVCWRGALSLTRGRCCRLQWLVALASAVILGSESPGTRDLILLSQIRDFILDSSYNSQGYGGGIRSYSSQLSLYGRGTDHKENRSGYCRDVLPRNCLATTLGAFFIAMDFCCCHAPKEEGVIGRCIETAVLLLLPAFSLPRECV
jgi:hypothetical protein